MGPAERGLYEVRSAHATVPACGYIRTADLEYGSLPRQKLDVYRPVHADPDRRVVIFFYGGDWQTGSKADYRFVAQALTSQGFIAVLPDYRLYPSSPSQPSSMTAQKPCDGSTIMSPALAATRTVSISWAIRPALTSRPCSRSIPLPGGRGTKTQRHSRHGGLVRPLRFCSISWRPARLRHEAWRRARSGHGAIDFVDGHEPPMLLIHGLKDQTVDASNAARLTARICQAGGRCDISCIPSARTWASFYRSQPLFDGSRQRCGMFQCFFGSIKTPGFRPRL